MKGGWGTPVTPLEEFLYVWICLWAILCVWITIMLVLT